MKSGLPSVPGLRAHRRQDDDRPVFKRVAFDTAARLVQRHLVADAPDKADGYDLVFDKSGSSLNGVPLILPRGIATLT